MDARAILTKIDEDAREASRKVLDDARARAKAMREASAAAIEKQRADALARAEADAGETEKRMQRMAELEDRKALLAAKREVIDRAFNDALSRLRALPKDKCRAFLLGQLLSLAQGGETLLIGAQSDGWFDSAFVEEANAGLKKNGKTGVITLGAEHVPGTGFALQKDGARVNCTLEALVEGSRHDMEADVARVLFD